MGLRGPLPRAQADVAFGANLVKRAPAPPKTLKAAGRAEWVRVAAELGPAGRNVLTEAAVGLLEDLARAIEDAEEFRAIWVKEGATVESKGRDMQHPMLVAERAARAVVHEMRKELGVTPSSVRRVPAGPERKRAKATSPLDEFDGD